MIDFDTEELIGTFESIEDNDFKVENLKAQIKMLNEDSSNIIKEFAKDKETKPKYIKNGYKHWREKKRSGDEDEDDLYTILALVDGALENEEAQE